MNRKIIHILLLALLSFMAGACSSAKKATSIQKTDAVESASVYFSGIIDGCTSWQQIKVPFNVSVSQPVQISASGQATMVRGKYINLSIRILGMEVAALCLTNDSVLAVDRWNKRYISENLRQFLKGFPANISNLQDLLTGRPFVIGENSLTFDSLNKFSVEQQGDSWGIEPKQSVAGVEYAFIFTARQLLSMIITAGASNQVNINYGEPVKTQSGTFASAADIKSDIAKKPVSATIQWRWNKAEFGDSFTPRHIEKPNNYTRVNASELLNKLKLQ